MAIVVMMYLAEQTKHVGHAGLLSAPSFKLILGYDTILPADLWFCCFFLSDIFTCHKNPVFL